MFEQFFSNLFAPDFAAKAAQAMDPQQFMLSLGPMLTGPTAAGTVTPAGPVPGPFSSMVGYEGMPMPDSIMPFASSTPTPDKPKTPKLELGAKDLAALQGMNQQPQRQATAPSAGIVTPRGGVSVMPIMQPDMQRRNPNGVSLGQLIYGR